MRKSFIIAISLIGLMVSCTTDEIETPTFTPSKGDEVKFSVFTGAEGTRTVYGKEENNQFPVYWVHNDLIKVYGPDCSPSRNQATYNVSTQKVDANGNLLYTDADKKNPDINLTQDYATDLIKNGDYGVQWKIDETNPNSYVKSNFYAIYPASDNEFRNFEDEEGAEIDGVAIVQTSISDKQNVKFVKATDNGKTVWKGQACGASWDDTSLPNAIMYAATPADMLTTLTDGSMQVNLRFKPFSTVLILRLNGPKLLVEDAQGNVVESDDPTTLTIEKITLTAENDIAGDFDLYITQGTDQTAATAAANTEYSNVNNEIEVYFQSLALSTNEIAEIPIFIIPGEDYNVQDWKITITTSTQEKYSYTFTLAEGTTNDKTTLVAGNVHKLNVPSLKIKSSDIREIEPENWMWYIPRNTYLSELSIPGAWYCTDSNYQNTTDLAKQYELGIRAFHIDCRLSITPGYDVDNVSGSKTYQEVQEHATNGILTLACSGTEKEESNWLSAPTGGMVSLTTVKSQVTNLINLIKENSEEYIEVILSVSNKPKTKSSLTAGAYTYGTVQPSMMLAAFNKMINELATDSNTKDYVYTKEITPNTTINEVLGKVFFKVNINCSETNLTSLATTYINNNTPALFSSASMADEDDSNKLIMGGNFSSLNSPDMFWGQNQTSTENAMKFYYHQCQGTAGEIDAPTNAIRKDAIWDAISHARDIYESNKHNALFQIGIGGWIGTKNALGAIDDTDKDGVSSVLKPFLNEIINAKLNNKDYTYTKSDGTIETKTLIPSPIGAVLMNHVNNGTTHSTQALITNILEMNTKLKLNRTSDNWDDMWPNGYIPEEMEKNNQGGGSGDGNM